MRFWAPRLNDSESVFTGRPEPAGELSEGASRHSVHKRSKSCLCSLRKRERSIQIETDRKMVTHTYKMGSLLLCCKTVAVCTVTFVALFFQSMFAKPSGLMMRSYTLQTGAADDGVRGAPCVCTHAHGVRAGDSQGRIPRRKRTFRRKHVQAYLRRHVSCASIHEF